MLHLPDAHAIRGTAMAHGYLSGARIVLIDHPVARLAPEALAMGLGSRLLGAPQMQDRSVGVAVQQRDLLVKKRLLQEVGRADVLEAGEIDADAAAGRRQ